MTPADRERIRRVAAAAQRRVIITHGTDTWWRRAYLQGLPDKVIVLTGALQPGRFSDSDAPFNLGMALAAVQLLAPGVYIAANGHLFDARRVRKNPTANCFEEAAGWSARPAPLTIRRRWSWTPRARLAPARHFLQQLDRDAVGRAHEGHLPSRGGMT
jgi:L-asparaginase/Glu-tRNA(Gln) amidotransferase subunit D